MTQTLNKLYSTVIPIAAGDIALSILNMGLVPWGLKLYEYRRQLLSGAGCTVFFVSTVMAFGNVLLGPRLAHALGLGPVARDLSFAARSVTLALGSAALAHLGGDLSLNAAMVVISGILFQMALGFGVGIWLNKGMNAVESRSGRLWRMLKAHQFRGAASSQPRSDFALDPIRTAAWLARYGR